VDVVLSVVVNAAQIDAVSFDETNAARSQFSSRYVELLNSTAALGDPGLPPA